MRSRISKVREQTIEHVKFRSRNDFPMNLTHDVHDVRNRPDTTMGYKMMRARCFSRRSTGPPPRSALQFYEQSFQSRYKLCMTRRHACKPSVTWRRWSRSRSVRRGDDPGETKPEDALVRLLRDTSCPATSNLLRRATLLRRPPGRSRCCRITLSLSWRPSSPDGPTSTAFVLFWHRASSPTN
jgi:hypothetical protein